MACDLCGAKGTPLTDLLDIYKTDEIKAVCPKCEKDLNAKLWKIRSVLDGWMRTTFKRWMNERRASLGVKAHPEWCVCRTCVPASGVQVPAEGRKE